jgi:hypothetical protein
MLADAADFAAKTRYFARMSFSPLPRYVDNDDMAAKRLPRHRYR